MTKVERDRERETERGRQRGPEGVILRHTGRHTRMGDGRKSDNGRGGGGMGGRCEFTERSWKRGYAGNSSDSLRYAEVSKETCYKAKETCYKAKETY